MKKQIDQLVNNITVLQRFAIDYPMDWPVEKYINISIDNTIRIEFFCRDTDREEVLGILGQTFGTKGWTAIPERYAQTYSWKRVIDAITITIYEAEKIPPLVERSVNPKEFPLLLK